MHWRSPCLLEQRIFTSLAKPHISPLWASDVHTCPKNVHSASPVTREKCSVSIAFLLSASPSVRLYISHMCIVTGLCEDCIKFWSQCKPDSSGIWPQVRTQNNKKLSREAQELRVIVSLHDHITEITLTDKCRHNVTLAALPGCPNSFMKSIHLSKISFILCTNEQITRDQWAFTSLLLANQFYTHLSYVTALIGSIVTVGSILLKCCF